MLKSTNDCSGLATIGSSSDTTIAKYTRISYAVNLQKVLELLEEAWTFSVSMDMSTHMSMSYLDIHIYLQLNRNGITNLQLLVIPVYKRHMDELILATAEEYLDVLCMLLKDTVIRISMEGYRKKTGCILGIATLFQNVAKPRFIKIWYGDPHLGIVLQGSYSKFGDDNCYQKLTHLISYLWRQQNIISKMR